MAYAKRRLVKPREKSLDEEIRTSQRNLEEALRQLDRDLQKSNKKEAIND